MEAVIKRIEDLLKEITDSQTFVFEKSGRFAGVFDNLHRIASDVKILTERQCDGTNPDGSTKPTRKDVIRMLIEVARAAYFLADDAEDDGMVVSCDPQSFARLSAALDALDTLPEPGPQIVGTGPAKAAAFLGLADTSVYEAAENAVNHPRVLK